MRKHSKETDDNKAQDRWNEFIQRNLTPKKLFIIALFLLFFSFLSPLIFSRSNIFGIAFGQESGYIGDTVGGLMNPFIAIAGIMVTFAAFYIQYEANQQQISNFNKEFNAQRLQYRKNQFESQFYEMLRLHKENANEIELTITRFAKHYAYETGSTYSFISETRVNGRTAFTYLIKELKLIHFIARNTYNIIKPKITSNELYAHFFTGAQNIKATHWITKTLNDVSSNYSQDHYHSISSVLNIMKIPNHEKWSFEFGYDLFRGHNSLVSHYYRHLFQTVKFVASQDEEFLTYEEKRKYLRILRAQLSNQEQTLLFYNWYSGFGKQWENESNKFFTDYRMIHNIYQDLLEKEIKLDEIFTVEVQDQMRKEKERTKDSLFEFQRLFRNLCQNINNE